jgi:hypothetical protein
MTTTRGLLDSLGLMTPPGGKPASTPVRGGPTGPTGPLKAPGVEPREEVPAAKKEKEEGKDLSDAELTKALKSLPADPPKRVEALADLVLKVSDTARRDPIVKALRDAIAKIQPIMSEADAKKKIDKAINDLVDKGVKEGIMQLLKAVIGKEPTKVDRDAPRQDGPNMPPKDLGEKIIKTPPIDLPFDKPPKLKVNRFRIEGLSKTYKPSKYFDFTLTTPDWFEVGGRLGAGWVVIASKDEYAKTGGRPTRLRDKKIETKGKLKMSLVAPDEPGRCVIYVVVGSGPEDSSVEEFDVAN